jgi:hypothetical protein
MRIVNKALLLAGGLVVVLLLGYQQRERLLVVGVNHYLAATALTLVDFAGLRISPAGMQLQQVELRLPASGQTLRIADIALDWQRTGLLALPQPEALRIASARLSAPVVTLPESAPVVTGAESSPFDVAGLLLVLRDFPLASIELAALELPDRTAPIKVSVRASDGNFSAAASSAQLSAALDLVQADAAAAAQLQLNVRIDEFVTGTLDFVLPPAGDPGEIAGSGSFNFTGRLQDEPFAARGTLQLPPCDVQRSSECVLQFDLSEASLAAWSAAAAAGDPLRVEGLLLSGSGSLSLDAQTLQWQLSGAEFQGSLAALNMEPYRLSSAFTLDEVESRLGASGAALSGSLGFATTGLTLTTPQPWLPAVDLEGHLVLSGTQLDFDSAVTFRDGSVATDLQVQGHHDLSSAAGSATLTLAPLQLAEGSTLSQRLGQWPFAWDLVLGALDAGLQLQWQDSADAAASTITTHVRGALQARLTNVAGYYGSTLFHGLNTEITADIDTAQALPLATPLLELSLAGLDPGLPLENLQLRVQLDAASNSVLLESLSAAVLGGSLAMTQQRYLFAASDNALELQFDGLRLDQVLALTGYEDVVVDGSVSGTVPLRFSAAGIEVAGGTLHALQPGGNIRYLGSLGAGDASLALVRQALSNYRFDALESSIDYSPEGELLLGMQLQGYNPELENGRRVNLNLNLSNDLRGLLQSLQAGRTIEDLVQELYE